MKERAADAHCSMLAIKYVFVAKMCHLQLNPFHVLCEARLFSPNLKRRSWTYSKIGKIEHCSDAEKINIFFGHDNLAESQ